MRLHFVYQEKIDEIISDLKTNYGMKFKQIKQGTNTLEFIPPDDQPFNLLESMIIKSKVQCCNDDVSLTYMNDVLLYAYIYYMAPSVDILNRIRILLASPEGSFIPMFIKNYSYTLVREELQAAVSSGKSITQSDYLFMDQIIPVEIPPIQTGR